MEVERPAPLKADAMDADAPGAPPRGGAAEDALVAADGGDLYTRLKALQRQLEFFEIQVRARREGGGAEAGERGTKGERGRAHRAPPRAAVWSTHPFPPPPSPHPHQEEYIREEQRSLKRELLRAQEEVKRIQSGE